MAEISKTEAIILKKTVFSNTSLIVQLYTKDMGRMSGIIKGALSPKSKIGSKIDLINNVELVFYHKEERELQVVTQANLINHYPIIKESIDKIKYASAVCELLLNLTPPHEVSDKIYRGSVRILSLMNDKPNNELLLFTKYLLFFIKEIGFEIDFDACSECGEKILESNSNGFNYSSGVICKKCNSDKLSTFQLSEELFELFKCLSSSNNDCKSIKISMLENIVLILEKYLNYHIENFRGIRSLKIL